MENSRLDFYDIFARKMTRKLHKGKINKVKYLNKPYLRIKQVVDIKFSGDYSMFIVRTTDKLLLFDSFNKQNIHTFDIKAKWGSFVENHYFHFDGGNVVLLNLDNADKMNLNVNLEDKIKNKEDVKISTFKGFDGSIGFQFDNYVIFINLESNTKVGEFIYSGYADKIRYLKLLSDNKKIHNFLGYKSLDNAIIILRFDIKTSTLTKVESAPSPIAFSEGSFKIKCSGFTHSAVIYNQTLGVVEVKKTDTSLHVSSVLLFSENEKEKLRCLTFCSGYKKSEFLGCLTSMHTQQNLKVIQLSSCNALQEASEQNSQRYTMKLDETKFRARRIFFHYLWNSFFFIDSDENLYLLEFYPPVYFENYWVKFKYIEENEVYQEKETEFDVPIQSPAPTNLYNLVNGLDSPN